MRNEVLTFKRERILEEASLLFYERGFTATTLDDIASRLGVTKPFIYGHFRSKAELLAAVCRPPLELTLAAASRAAKGKGSHADRLRRLTSELTQITLENQPNVSIYAREALSLDAPVRNEIESLRNRRNRVIVDLLRAGVAAREFEVEDVATTGLALLGLISGVSQGPKNGSRTPGEDMPEHMARLALRMVGARECKPARVRAVSASQA
jgi:AcrR family transcriptional regulator